MSETDHLPSMDDLTGVYEEPPKNVVQSGFTDGALMGNGDLGVAVGGDYRTITCYFGKNDFWTDDAPLNQDGHRFNGVRPIMVGVLDLQIGRIGKSSYRMEQDIGRAQVRSYLSVDRSKVTVFSWTAATENLLVMDMMCEGKESLPVTLELWCPTLDAFPAKRWDTLHVVNGSYAAQAGVEDEIGWVARETHAGEGVRWVCRAAVAVTVQGADVRMVTDEDRRVLAAFTLTPRKPVKLLVAIEGGKDRTDHISGAIAQIRRTDNRQLGRIYGRHRDWWRAYWLKSSVRLHDPDLEKYYYGALYCMACCSREGKVAPGLMGNWFTTDQPMCHSDYHLNYNFQAPFYGLYAANRLEQVMPYYEPIIDYIPEGKWRARNEIDVASPLPFPKGVRGVLYPVGIGPWGSTPDDNYHNQVSDATFAAIPFIWHYEHTLDVDFLRKVAYPFMKELADFWEDYLQKDEDGRYVVHAASYEGYQDINPAQDLGFIRLLLRHLIKYSRILKVAANRRERWQDILDHLSEPPTTTYKKKKVYNHAETDRFLVGFTTDNIEWIFPGECLGLGDDPEKLKTAHDTIRLIDAWTQGNNVPKIFPQAVRVGYPIEEIIEQFKALMETHFRPNLTLRENGGGIETAGSIETFNSMLLQSHEGFLRLFPVWFNDKPASFVRLRARGAFLVSSSLSDGNVEYVEITSERGEVCHVLNPWFDSSLHITTSIDGEPEELKYTIYDDIISFETQAGGIYRMTHATEE